MKLSMRKNNSVFLAFPKRTIREVYLPRIERCLEILRNDQIWWRPSAACNSVGNLVLHLQGNVRQWIVSGLGGAKDVRERDQEFSQAGPVPRRVLLAGLRRAVRQALSVIGNLSESDLRRTHEIQGYRVSGHQAILHVTEHFSHHAGQIIYITKLLTGRNLGFTHLPGDRTRKGRRVLRAV